MTENCNLSLIQDLNVVVFFSVVRKRFGFVDRFALEIPLCGRFIRFAVIAVRDESSVISCFSCKVSALSVGSDNEGNNNNKKKNLFL